MTPDHDANNESHRHRTAITFVLLARRAMLFRKLRYASRHGTLRHGARQACLTLYTFYTNA